MKLKLLLACLACSPSSVVLAQTPASDESPLDLGDPIVVTAEFRGTELLDLSGSATVIDAETIEQREAAHIEQILNLAPNVNFSSGASRGRFFQIRGIGARSQFVEPSNASVGLVVDGIDLTGLGGAATTLDIAQVEILRGPQGTLFGANALAGMINMVSASPTEVFSGEMRLRLAERDTREFEGAISGPLGESLGYRMAYSNVRSNGYQDNAFLGIDDNGAIDEQTLRGRLRWQASDSLSIDFGALLLDVDNRYDGFSLDNTRTTLSDELGHDRQETVAGSARLIWQARPALSVEALLSHADADLEYGYDEDWSFDGFCDVFDCVFDAYSSFDNYLRDNRNTTVDLRMLSGEPGAQSWVLGAYYRDQSQSLRRIYTYLENDFLSDFDTENRALYGQYDLPLSESLLLKAGLRYEQRDADYTDSDGAAFDPDEDFWGGRLALEYRSEDGHLFYALASRGYKAGGVNSDSTVPDAQREYATETLWNYELGIKTRLRDGRLDLRTALFFQDRDDIQTQQSLVLPIDGELCPCRFIEYISNATAGQSYGLETEFNWWISPSVQAYGSLGLLDSRFDDFQSFSHVEADPETGQAFDLDGRDLPHAPNYMFSLGAVFRWADHWYLRAEVEGKDAFYFSSRHEERSNAYELFNLRLGYQLGLWEVALWARNLGDETVRVRGFGSFGNDPRKGYAVEPYYQFGEPRTVGLSASYAF
ncbi:TonB-dependent receptor [Wenzhouxiangella marina]|uniref:TonB-dependent receptor n=1 Tax=Wenzhouxiangella marina TaxID=1579979 RepID=A0A0K0XU87_9GAMM|nr:TonB-dependent receptor [Wenzhouxiangella marina]AKS41220.1 TonB-dependent receptor [Wenzhouxiangella marina]MBB6088100.1 outer membrane receptor protein involved in Fe transport [Wenzhouxiangella marina]